MGAEWVLQLTPMIFTRIKAGMSEKTKNKYNMSNKNFSTVEINKTSPVFPFVYVKTLASMEKGRDLEAVSINGGLFSYQIEVTDNKSQETAREVMSEVIKVMKKMSFEVNAIPEFESTKDSYRCVARFRRTIDENDVL